MHSKTNVDSVCRGGISRNVVELNQETQEVGMGIVYRILKMIV